MLSRHFTTQILNVTQETRDRVMVLATARSAEIFFSMHQAITSFLICGVKAGVMQRSFELKSGVLKL